MDGFLMSKISFTEGDLPSGLVYSITEGKKVNGYLLESLELTVGNIVRFNPFFGLVMFQEGGFSPEEACGYIRCTTPGGSVYISDVFDCAHCAREEVRAIVMAEPVIEESP